MPKLRKTAAELRHERNLKIADIARTACVRSAGDLDTLIQKIGISKSTWFRRMQNPEEFTLGQIQELARLLDEDDRERLKGLVFG